MDVASVRDWRCCHQQSLRSWGCNVWSSRSWRGSNTSVCSSPSRPTISSVPPPSLRQQRWPPAPRALSLLLNPSLRSAEPTSCQGYFFMLNETVNHASLPNNCSTTMQSLKRSKGKILEAQWTAIARDSRHDPPSSYTGPKQHPVALLAKFSSSSFPRKRGCRSHNWKNRDRSEQAVKHVSWTGQPRDFESWLACPCQQVNPTITLQSAGDYPASSPGNTRCFDVY